MTAASLRADEGLVVALQTARAWGAPPSVFWGEAKRSVTRYRHDDVGRLAETSTVHEPLWTDEDRELAFALAEYEADLCICGRPLTESMDAAHEFAYVGELAGRCHACTAQDTAARPFEDSPTPGALRFRVTLDQVRAATGRARVEAARQAAEAEAGSAGRGADGTGAVAGAEPGPETGG